MLAYACCCPRALYWYNPPTDSMTALTDGGYATMRAHLDDIQVELDNPLDFKTIDHYQLIFCPLLKAEPSWWNDLIAGTWPVRVYLIGEHSGFAVSNAHISSLSPITGMTIIDDSLDGGVFSGTIESDPLMAGVTQIFYNLTSRVSGGTALSKAITGLHPWLSHNKVGRVDWVVGADLSGIASNRKFYQNLWTVPI